MCVIVRLMRTSDVGPKPPPVRFDRSPAGDGVAGATRKPVTGERSGGAPRPALAALKLIGGGPPQPPVARSTPTGTLLAPGVRLAETRPEPPPLSRTQRRKARQRARDAQRGGGLGPIPQAKPSRPERADLIPQPGPVVAPRAFDGLTGPALVHAIRESGQMTEHLGYRPAREAMFRVIDNVRGVVEGVYTGRKVRTTGIPSADGDDGMNTEHTWPQSKGVKGTPAKYDLHHLFPTNTYANGRRGSYPFGVVGEHVRWQQSGSKLGHDGDGRVVFEPRDEMKGAVARALFYVSTLYGLEIPQHEEVVLRQWNRDHPPTLEERTRNDEISRFQGNRNPFVDQPALADEIERFRG